MVSSEADRDKWLSSFRITSGLRYFGGKAFIGKYLMNHICNMACRMNKNEHGPSVFIDASAGGGKIGLSIPEGWFDTIVMNDLNYGVYSFFKSCKENPTALVKMIEFMGRDYCEEMFYMFALNRSNGNQLKLARTEAEELIEEVLYKKDKKERIKQEYVKKNLDIISDVKLDELTAGAMTYWVTQTTWNGDTEPSTATYRYKVADNKADNLSNFNEKERIAKAIKHAQTHVFRVHKLIKKKNIIIENLDYRELIKKYNGMPYKNVRNEVQEPCEAMENILWYFDPPYHPATLCGGNSAPYEDTFSLEMSREMVKILYNDEKDEEYGQKTYGKISYFIKSDYDPKDCLEKARKELKISEEIKEKKLRNREMDSEELKKYNEKISKIEDRIAACEDAEHDFDDIEDESKGFKKVEVGSFDKGGIGKDNEKTQGTEFIWYRG